MFDIVKNKLLCSEVKYAQLTCLLLKPTAQVCRPKRDHKNLKTREYVENLMSYLDNTRSCKKHTLDYLSNALYGVAPTIVVETEVCGNNNIALVCCILLLLRESRMVFRCCS